MLIIGPEVPGAALRFTPGEPVQWVLPADWDGLTAPVVKFAGQFGEATPPTVTGARTTGGRWAFSLDAATSGLLSGARRFEIFDGERSVLAGHLQPRRPYYPDVSTGDVTYVPGPQWVEESPGIWRA